MRPPGNTLPLNVVFSDSGYHQLPWWQRLLHHWDILCRQDLPRYVLVRQAGALQSESARLGEVWTLCGACGRVLEKRRELPVDATRFGVAKSEEEL